MDDGYAETVSLEKRYVCPNCGSARLEFTRDLNPPTTVCCLACGIAGDIVYAGDGAGIAPVVRFGPQTDAPEREGRQRFPVWHPAPEWDVRFAGPVDSKEHGRLYPIPAESQAPRTALEFLTEAGTLMAERGKQYDKAAGERSMASAVRAFNAVTGHSLTESEGWAMLLVLKLVRQWSNPAYHRDSAEDTVAYAALLGESLERDALDKPF